MAATEPGPPDSKLQPEPEPKCRSEALEAELAMLESLLPEPPEPPSDNEDSTPGGAT